MSKLWGLVGQTSPTHTHTVFITFFGPDHDNFDKLIKEIDDYGLSLTVEKYVFDFLGVEVKTDNQSSKVTLTQ